jgi:hypothetical protein
LSFETAEMDHDIGSLLTRPLRGRIGMLRPAPG